jgi:hypothetical protein
VSLRCRLQISAPEHPFLDTEADLIPLRRKGSFAPHVGHSVSLGGFLKAASLLIA